nr:putative carbohydrate binding domain containing protein [uncultured Mediterranean phage uvMED]
MATVNLGAIKFNWKGAYNNSTAYAVDDVVSSGGSSYVCILASQGNAVTNGTYWSVMAQAGTDGTNVATTLTTQGDILYRNGSGLQRLGAGTSGNVLTTKGSGQNPVWEPAVGGKIGQVIYYQNTTAYTVSGSSSSPNYTTFLTASITPSATSSKVLILTRLHTGSDGGNHTYIRLQRGSTNLPLPSSAGSRSLVHSSTGYGSTWFAGDQVVNMLDSPNTTSSTTYNLRMGSEGNSYVNRSSRDNDAASDHRGTSDMILMEVLA